MPGLSRTEDILELNRRIIDLNKQKSYTAEGKLVVPKFDVGVAPVWFQQAGVEHFSRKDVLAGRVIPTRDPQRPSATSQGPRLQLMEREGTYKDVAPQ